MDPDVLQASARQMGFQAWDGQDELTGGRSQTVVVWKRDQHFVLKAYDPAGPSAGAREQSALHALDGASGTPRSLAEGVDPPWVLMSRLAGTGSLADALLGSDPEAARGALLSWADALARLHEAGTPQVRAAFRTALEGRAPHLDARSLPKDFTDAAAKLPRLLDELSLPGHEAALSVLQDLPARLAGEEWEVLSPADACPDNNLLDADGMRLLDFEFAELRHAAWDVAYLRVPWPSCWCAWRLPDDVADEAVARYCSVRGAAAQESDFQEAIDLATLGWQVMTSALFIPGALTDDDNARTDRPSRRAFVLHRLGQAACTSPSNALTTLAGDLHGALRERWGDLRLDQAPSFRL